MAALVVVSAPVAWLLTLEEPEEIVEVSLAPDIEDFAVEEEEPPPEQEEEPAAEPPPPPPPNVKVKKVKGPVKRSKIENPDDKPTEAADESDLEKEYLQPEGETSLTGTGTEPSNGRGGRKPGKAPKNPKPKEKAPEPKPRTRKKKTSIDPTKPIDRPENATAPKPNSSNKQPAYPKSLRDEGITGRVVIKLHVHRDGTVRGAKVLSKKNNATGEDDQKKANKLFLAAVISVVKTWKYTPATLEGKPISVWHTVTFPFNLTD